MKTSYIITALLLLLGFTSCIKEKRVTSEKDYAAYLNTNQSEVLTSINKEHLFWTQKLEKTPNQFPYLVKIASAESNLFEATGLIKNLINAEQKLVEINKKTNYNNAGYLRMLAKNYISQHKFNEALALLKKAEINGENLIGTQKMLFDVYLELGNKEQAKTYLSLFEDETDFDYIIRLSKWSDHEGDLDLAIFLMKKATKIAEQLKNKTLIQWSYTNLADFLGHANQIDASYSYYLKALELNPHDAYAKKGIAWIVYSHEKNPIEAIEILNKISENNATPDYYLLKAEIYEFLNQKKERKEAVNSYLSLVQNKYYGTMYSKYNVNVYIDEFNNTEKAIEIAKQEIKNRPTAQSYDLLAWSYFKNGDLKKAHEIITESVINKTSEPEILYHIAEIYKANNDTEDLKNIKQELLESSYELGPLMTQKIKTL